jgi:hypothetical protein
VSVDVDEFVRKLSSMFWKLTLFYLFLTLALFFFIYTEEGNGNFKLLSRATTPSDQKITTVLPTILACGYGVCVGDRGRVFVRA